MHTILNAFDFVPQNVPQNMNGKLSFKICIKKDHTRRDGTNSLYIDIYYLRKRKRLSLDIAVPVKFFDTKRQRIKSGYKYAKDYNLIIEKTLGVLNKIEVNYRLNDEIVTLDKVVEDYMNPSIRINFNSFSKHLLDYQIKENIIAKSTYRQQNTFIEKIKGFQDPIPFSDINEDFVSRFRVYLKNTLKNKPTTIESTLKNFKKYLHAANSKGIRTELHYTQISIGSMTGDFTFLLPVEIKRLLTYYHNEFINEAWKAIQQRYLFSCYTGLRISDIELITEDNFVENTLVFTANKTGKLQKIKLNSTAKSLINLPEVFKGNFTREHINRELKHIAKACGINKRLSFHSSRHTFATNYLIAGGQIQNLQKLLGHSKIETTMVYAHTVESLQNKEIELMDGLFED